jgi:hypothetical protein
LLNANPQAPLLKEQISTLSEKEREKMIEKEGVRTQLTQEETMLNDP